MPWATARASVASRPLRIWRPPRTNRPEIESSSAYRISMILGEAGRGEEGRSVFSETVGRRVDRVERTIGQTTEEAVAGPGE